MNLNETNRSNTKTVLKYSEKTSNLYETTTSELTQTFYQSKTNVQRISGFSFCNGSNTASEIHLGRVQLF